MYARGLLADGVEEKRLAAIEAAPWLRSTKQRKARRTVRCRAPTRSKKTPMLTGHRHGGTDLPRRGRIGDRAEMARDENVVFSVKTSAVPAAYSRRPSDCSSASGRRACVTRRSRRWRFSVRDGRGDDRLAADRRDHVFGFPRRVLGYSGEPNGEGALHSGGQFTLRSSCAPPTAGAYASARSIRKRWKIGPWPCRPQSRRAVVGPPT